MKTIDVHVNLLPDFARTNVSAAAIPGESEHLRHCFDLPATAPINARCESGHIVAEMDKAGIDLAVAFSYQWNTEDRCKLANDHLLAEVARHRARLRGLLVVQPAMAGAADYLEKLLDAPGIIGVKMKPRWAGFSLADAKLLGPICELLIRKRKMLLTHVSQSFHRPTGDQVTDLFALLKNFPRLTVVGAHMAGMAGVYECYEPVRRHLENLFVDISLPANLAWLPQLMRQGDPSRYLYATDFPYMDWADFDAKLARAGLTEREMEMVRWSNPRRLLDSVAVTA